MAATKSLEEFAAQHRERFADVESNASRILLPIQGYADKPLASIEEAVEPLASIIHDIKRMAACAKWNCKDPPSDQLSRDQSAAIMLYSMEWEPQDQCLYFVLNATLRDENRQKLKPWFLYLKLFFTGLAKLPAVQRTVFRGVRGDLRDSYQKGQTITWWGFSSCTLSMDLLGSDQYFGSTGPRTFFAIECTSGRDIRNHSAFQHENEILLPAGRLFEVVSCLRQGEDLCMIHLRETRAPFPLVDLVPEGVNSNDATASYSGNVSWKATPPYPARWNSKGVTVAGGNGTGSNLEQLNRPCGLFVDDDRRVFIVDSLNHRILVWDMGAKAGRVVAGGKGQGNRLDQLNQPMDMVLDKTSDSLIVCDRGNRRVVSWPCRQSSSASRLQGKVLVENIDCQGITIDQHGCLYVSDTENHEVKRYGDGYKSVTVVAGNHKAGKNLHQLHRPTNLFVDNDCSIYISDMLNHRVVKWMRGASEGIIVAGHDRKDANLEYLSVPRGLWVDRMGHIYVVDQLSHRVTRWENGAAEARLIVGGFGDGQRANQLDSPNCLFFDRQGHMYVSDCKNERVQRFFIDTN